MPRISVIIAAYRCEKWLARTLESVRRQTVDDWECIVVDDGSPDDCSGVVLQFGKDDGRIRLVRQKNGGISLARNHGIFVAHSSSEFLNFLDADDVLHPHAFASLLGAIDVDSKALGVHSLGDFIDENDEPLDAGVFATFGRSRVDGSSGILQPWPIDRPSTLATVATASTAFPLGMALLRRQAVIEAGSFDPLIRHAEDWDLLMRMCRRGHIAFLDSVLLQYRRHASNAGTQSDIPEWCRRAFWKNFHAPGNTPDQNVLFKNVWRARQRNILKLRMASLKTNLSSGRIRRSLADLGRVPFVAFRWARGFPTLSLV